MTHIAQENFDRAVSSAAGTITKIAYAVQLQGMSVRELESMAWDLEAIQAAIRIEINNRSGTMDLG